MYDPRDYPNVPGSQRGSDTSMEAAASVMHCAEAMRVRVYEFVLTRPVAGATCDEIQVKLGMIPQTASARCTELKQLGLLFDSGFRRNTRHKRPAAVLMANEFG
jgi:hypothetical protein